MMPGDTQSGLTFQLQLSRASLDLTWVPLWLFTLRWSANKPPLQVLVNGQTHKAHGKLPVSPARVALVVALIALVIGAGLFGLSVLEAR